MKKRRKTSEDFENLGLKIIAKYRKFSPTGKIKSLRKIDEIIAGESDTEMIELLKEFKSLLESK